MNYLSHAYRFLDDPYFAAGTGLPDWMSVLDRKNRARRQFAITALEQEHDSEVLAFVRGCIQHHDDDRWFHMGERFNLMSTQFAVELRSCIGPNMGHQSSFVGHISIELLLDAILCERDPELLSRYYQMLASLDAEKMQLAANQVCRKPVTMLPTLVTRFLQERFLEDYHDDQLLLYRLNGVMRRVRLPALPVSVAEWLGTARTRVREAADELLSPPAETAE